jgi:mannose-6-phosphate isomerase-like protein (cupin superfamily)
MRVRTPELVRLLGVISAVVAWLGWFEIAPALGFPTIGPAAMLNRVIVPESNPGVWQGWLVMVLGLVLVAAVFALATAREWIPSGPMSGVLFGLAAWAVAGMVLMVILGRISPPAPAPPAPPGPALPTTPDPMHATFLMLHLGGLAPVEALLAWLLFGAVIGSTFDSIEPAGAWAAARSPGGAGLVLSVGLLILLAGLMAAGWILKNDTAGAQGSTDVGRQVLASGPAEALPDGAVFVSIIELPQAPGAKLGPHAHVPGFAYVRRGREVISFPLRPTLELDPGEGGFMSALAIHSHENRNRVPAAALAVLLLAIGLALAIVSLLKITPRRPVMAALSGLLLVAGAVALWDPWVNDWYFIAVRPASARGGAMPLPDASRVYESPDLDALSAGPYTEKLQVIILPVGGQTSVDHEPGPETFLVLSGEGTIQMNGDVPTPLGKSQAVLAQQGASVRLSNPGGDSLSVLSFSVVGSDGSS